MPKNKSIHLSIEDQSIKQLREYASKLIIAIAKKSKVISNIHLKLTGNTESLYQLARFDSSLLAILAKLKFDRISVNSKAYWLTVVTYLRDKLKSYHVTDSGLRKTKRVANYLASNPSEKLNAPKSLGVGVTRSSNDKSKLPKHIDVSKESKKVSRVIGRHYHHTKLNIVLSDKLGNAYTINIINTRNVATKIGYIILLEDKDTSTRIDNLPIKIIWEHKTLKANNYLFSAIADIDTEVIKIYSKLISTENYTDKLPTREYEVKNIRSNKNNNLRTLIECTRDRFKQPDIEHNARLSNHRNTVKRDRRSLYQDRLIHNEVSTKKPLTIR